jgi:ribonuclease HI
MADWKEAQETTPVLEPEHWVMYFNGSKLLHGSGARVTLKSPKGDELSYVLQIHFSTTNNIAEYEALLHGLRVAKEIGVQHIMCCKDSDLVAQQVAGTYKARTKLWRYTEMKWMRWQKVSSGTISSTYGKKIIWRPIPCPN